MKKLLCVLLFLPTLVMAQPSFDDIQTALNNGDAPTLSKYFDTTVDINILGDEQSYDKANAETVLKNFFSKYSSRTFQLMHKGASRGSGAEYAIGSLQTSSKKFRVFVYMKEVGTKIIIQQMRFEE